MRTLLIFALFFLSPLVFFTDLTRNPFCFQQFLMSICLVCPAVVFFARGIVNVRMAFPATPLDFPFLLFSATAAVSFVFSYFGHSEFYRPAIFNFTRKEILFLISACVTTFYISVGQKEFSYGENSSDSQIAQCMPESSACKIYFFFILAWTALWIPYPLLRDSSPSLTIPGKIFDPYGTLLFIAAFFCIRPMIKGGSRSETLRLIATAGIIASLYGLLQFFGGEVIWAKFRNPYGNRPVSTFGNPNFLSSFVAMMLPFVFYNIILSKGRYEKAFYGLAVFSYIGVLLCSMARSSWIGAAAGVAVLFYAIKKGVISIPEYNRPFFRKFLIAAILFVLFFPSGNGSFKPILISRAADLFSGLAVKSQPDAHKNAIMEKNFHFDTAVSTKNVTEEPESPVAFGKTALNISVYQRLMMWVCGWQMGLENPLLGKGFGQYELFSSFYQGRLLASFPHLRDLRTHANEAHNEIVQKWSETGIAGLAAILLAVVICVKMFYAKCKTMCKGGRTLFIPLAAGMAAMSVDNMANVSFHFFVPAAIFFYISGAFVAECGGLSFSPSVIMPGLWGKEFTKKYVYSIYPVFIIMLLWSAFAQTRIFLRETAYFAGYKAFRTSRPMEAAMMLEKAMKYDSSDVNTAYEAGNIMLTISERKKGEKYLWDAIHANAGYDELYYNMASAMSKEGRFEEAVRHIQLSTVINPFSRSSWNSIARIYTNLPFTEKNLRSSSMAFSEAERIFPENAEYPNILGYMYMQAGMEKESAAVLAKAVHDHPENNMLCENFLLANSKTHTENDTEAWIRQYHALAVELGSFLDNAPEEKTLSGLKSLDNFIALNPNDFRLYELRAKYLFKLKRYEEASQNMKRVLEYVPMDFDVRYGLATIYEASGRNRMAVAELDYMLEQDPGNARAIAKKETVLKKINKF